MSNPKHLRITIHNKTLRLNSLLTEIKSRYLDTDKPIRAVLYKNTPTQELIDSYPKLQKEIKICKTKLLLAEK